MRVVENCAHCGRTHKLMESLPGKELSRDTIEGLNQSEDIVFVEPVFDDNDEHELISADPVEEFVFATESKVKFVYLPDRDHFMKWEVGEEVEANGKEDAREKAIEMKHFVGDRIRKAAMVGSELDLQR